MHEDIERILITETELRERISQLGKELTAQYADKNPVFIGVLKGVILFYADMIRAFDAPCQTDFLWISSYEGTESTGKVQVRQDVTTDLRGRHVIVLEDIVDTGRSLRFVCEHLRSMGVASLKVCTLLDKPLGRADGVQFEADFVGFTIPKAFVVGYGLDYNELYRNLPYIGILKPEIYSN